MSWLPAPTAGLLMLLASFSGCEAQAPEEAPAKLAGPVRFSRTGGFAGFFDVLEISPSGEVRWEDETEIAERLTAERLETLTRTLDKVDFDVSTSGHGADQIRYSLEYQGRTLHWTDASAPSGLGPALEILHELLQPRADP